MSCSNIIVVGNGGCLLKQKNGSIIDSFDCVVRMGNCSTAGYEQYVGKKTDIYRASWDRLLHNITKSNRYRPIEISFEYNTLLFLEQQHDVYCEVFGSFLLRNNFKLFSKPYFSEISFPENIFLKCNERLTHESCLDFFIKKHSIKNIEYMDIHDRVRVFKEMNDPVTSNMVLPSSGILTLEHILTTRPADNVYITGFDGFTTRYYWRDNETYFDGNSSYREKLYIKKLLKCGRVNLLS